MLKYSVLFLLLLIAPVNAASQRYFSLQELQSLGLKTYYDATKQRLLVQGEKGHTAFLLPETSYSLVDGIFFPYPVPLRIGKEHLEISADFIAEKLWNFFPEEKRERLKIGPPKVSPQAPALSAPSTPASIPCVVGRPVKKIFLDPGHGGSDFGTGYEGILEKDIVLRFSKLVALELKKIGVEVTFSRTKDVFLPLDIRSELAKRWGADLFISIHVNSSPSASVHGTETYILNADATDAEARKLALEENSVAGAMAPSKGVLKDILWDMEQTTYLQSSAHLAAFLQKSAVRSQSDLLDRGVRQAPFFVLSRAAMPAVLVELGYLSNRNDRRLLTNKKFQENLAKALASGVKMYKDSCKAR